MLFRGHVLTGRSLSLVDRRQDFFGLIVARRLVQILLIQLQEPVERHHGAGRPQDRAALAVDHVDRGLIQLGAGHLACHGALPDQRVQLPLVWINPTLELIGSAGNVGRPDRLMGFLGVLRLGGVDTCGVRQVLVAELAADPLADRTDRLT